MIQALLFDAAGTLIRPAEPVAATYARLLSPDLGPLEPSPLGSAFGRAFKNAGTPDYHKHPDGDSAERAWWRLVVEDTVGQTVPDDAFCSIFNHYADGSAWQLYPEVVSALRRAKDAELRCAVISNFDLRLHRILDQLGLTPYFDLILTSAEAKARKPSPQFFAQALRRLELAPHQVLHVGDSAEADLNGAAKAGIDAYLLQRPERNLEHFIDWLRPRLGN